MQFLVGTVTVGPGLGNTVLLIVQKHFDSFNCLAGNRCLGIWPIIILRVQT